MNTNKLFKLCNAFYSMADDDASDKVKRLNYDSLKKLLRPLIGKVRSEGLYFGRDVGQQIGDLVPVCMLDENGSVRGLNGGPVLAVSFLSGGENPYKDEASRIKYLQGLLAKIGMLNKVSVEASNYVQDTIHNHSYLPVIAITMK